MSTGLRFASLAVLGTAIAGAWVMCAHGPEQGTASVAIPEASARVQALRKLALQPAADARRPFDTAAVGEIDAALPPPEARLLEAAESLAQKLDPSDAPRVQDVIDFLCLLTRSLQDAGDPAALERLGIHIRVDPTLVRIDIPVAAGVDGERFLSSWLELEFSLLPGDTSLDVRRLLLPSAEGSPADPAFSGDLPATSAVEVDFGEWRGGEWSWELSDGWFDAPAVESLRFATRAEGDMETAGVDRDCLTADALSAWAAALPWFGPVPPALEPQSSAGPLFAAAERLAASLDPARVPSLSEVLDFVCAAVATLGPGPGMTAPRDVAVTVRPVADGLQVRLPVHAGVVSPDFRAGFLVLELSDLSSGGTLVVWRELVPALVVPPPSDGREDPRFAGEQPISSWLELSLAEGQMSLGDVLLYSRRADDWYRTAPREGCEDLPIFLGGSCLVAERLQAWEQGLRAEGR